MDGALIERMCALLEHRGPDSRGVFLDEGVGMGVQRLAVIDLETGDQPVWNEDRSIVVVANAEIYNYRELREELAGRGHELATRSDTEVIAHLYEDHGEACVDRLHGMFAFALWDRRARKLLLARDRVGKKPLFYAHRNGCLWFGSAARAILADDDVPRDVDYQAIDSFLHYQYVPHPRSAFAALRKLPPAHVLTFDAGRLSVRRYWKLSYRPRLAGVADGELHDLIRQQLLEATRLRLRSDVPLGALLSGGIDSSSVVAAMSRLTAEPVKTFSIGFDAEGLDERPYAREVARLYGTDHHELEVEPRAMDVLPRLVWHYGEPFADQSAVPTFHLAELARRHVTVALDGDGGDESFAGYHRYVGLTPRARVRDHLSALLAPRRHGRAVGEQVLDRHSERIAFGYFDDHERLELYEPEFLRSLGERPWRSVVAEPYHASDAQDALNRILDVDVQTYLPDDLLVKVDVASMANSLEVRSPLLDHYLMETAAALPAEAKLDGKVTKRVFKEAVRGWLPDRIVDRPKAGFTVPLAEWFRGPLRELPEEVLLDPRSLERGFFREGTVRGLLADHLAGTADNSCKIWSLLQLELWLRTYVDRSATEAPLALAVS